jgi:catechol 2,3-dioxygenase-like lactoylglutathione lyase family enzyme
MRIEHIALWTHDLERLRQFYETYFAGPANTKYVNPRTQFESYFIEITVLGVEDCTKRGAIKKPLVKPHERLSCWARRCKSPTLRTG